MMCGSKRAVDRADDPASTSGLRLPSAVRPVITVTTRDDPALGLASCRVDGHIAVQPNGLDPDRITSLRSPTARAFFAGRAAPIRSWV